MTNYFFIQARHYTRSDDTPFFHNAEMVARTLRKRQNACVNLEYGIDAYSSIMESPRTFATALENAPRLLEEAA